MKLTKRTLYQKTKPVDFKYPIQNELLAKQLLKFMHESGGIGLAANQVGLRSRVFVMAVDNNEKAFFNPMIQDAQGSTPYLEGCLSYPNESVELDRPETIVLSYNDSNGNMFVETFSGLEARVIQHEVDHLDGITMMDRKLEKQYDKQP